MSTLEHINKCLLEMGYPAIEDIETNFRDKLGLDSLEWLELIVLLEDEFGFEIPEEDYEKITTVKQAVDYIEHRLKPDGN